MANIQKVAMTLIKLREEYGLSQAQLSEILGVSTSTVSLWEAGLRSPNKRMQQTICQYFDCDLNYLFGYSDYKKSSNETMANVQQIVLYDRNALVDNGTHLSKSNKLIFDTAKSLNVISLPKELFLENTGYFAIQVKEGTLNPYGVNIGDIAVFKNASCDEVDNNKVVCALHDNKIIIRVYINVDRNTFILRDGVNQESDIVVKKNNDCLVGVLRLGIGQK